ILFFFIFIENRENKGAVASHLRHICFVIKKIISPWVRRYKGQLSWYLRGVEAEIGRLQLDRNEVYLLKFMQRCLDNIRQHDVNVNKMKEMNEKAKRNSSVQILVNPLT